LSDHLTPERLQARPQFATCRAARTATRAYHQVDGRQLMLMQPEGFSNRAADPIAFDPAARHLHRHGEPEARTATFAWPDGDTEELIAQATSTRMYRVELRLATNAPAGR
jgi:hypothetical protein